MIELILVNESGFRMPRKFINRLVTKISKEPEVAGYFKKNKVQSMSVAFLSRAKAKKMNFNFRQKNYATDVLSFESAEAGHLGDLVICPEVIERQAQEHGLSFQEECGYMIIHGVLHLIGYDHETNDRDAQKMYRVQDRIFEDLFGS